MDVSSKSYSDACIQTSPTISERSPVTKRDLYDCLGVSAGRRRHQDHRNKQIVTQESKEHEDAYLTQIYDFSTVEEPQISTELTSLASKHESPGGILNNVGQRRIVSLPERYTTLEQTQEDLTERCSLRSVSMPNYSRRRLPMTMDDTNLSLYEHACDNSFSICSQTGLSTVDTSPPKPIPALHGPASLPYARCPSGADGIIISAPCELPNLIWGLNKGDPRKSALSSINEEGREVHFQNITSEAYETGPRRSNFNYDCDEECRTPLPPAYESPVLDDGPTLPLYDQTRRDYLGITSSLNTIPEGLDFVGDLSRDLRTYFPVVRSPRSLDVNATPFIPQATFPTDTLAHGNHEANSIISPCGTSDTTGMEPGTTTLTSLDLQELMSNLQINNRAQKSDTQINTNLRKDPRTRNHRTGLPAALTDYPQRQDRSLPSMPISLHQLVVPNDQEYFSDLSLKPQPPAGLYGVTFDMLSPSDAPLSTPDNGISYKRAKYPRSIPLKRLLQRRLSSVPEETTFTYNSNSESRRCVSDPIVASKRTSTDKTEQHTGTRADSDIDVQVSERLGTRLHSPPRGKRYSKPKLNGPSSTRKRHDPPSEESHRPKNPPGRKYQMRKKNTKTSRSGVKVSVNSSIQNN